MRSHVHLHYFLKDGKETLQEKKTVSDVSDAKTYMFNFKDELLKSFVVYTSIETYAFHKNAAQEYIKYQATVEDSYELTIHVFSCYCTLLNVNQEPPF